MLTYEIELLKAELEKTRQERDEAVASKNTAFAAFGRLIEDKRILQNERDFARREICTMLEHSTNKCRKEHAKIREWDCFSRQEQEDAMNRLAALDEEMGLI